jgi:hypothetical protein
MTQWPKTLFAIVFTCWLASLAGGLLVFLGGGAVSKWLGLAVMMVALAGMLTLVTFVRPRRH